MTITIFSGTFNPVHLGHLIVAETVRNELGVEKIIFIPAYNPPHRNTFLASPEHRLNMVNLAVKTNNNFEVSDIEYKLQGKSFSYETVKKLYELNPHFKGKINFIIGTDAFKLIDTWHEPEKLSELVRFIIVNREESFDQASFFRDIKLRNFDYNVIKIPFIEISSTYIRSNIDKNKSIKYLVTDCVEKYILENKLFKNNY
jgi:nicotinate-nucleotide adenylyltransferase